jgi:hypothetical protein
MSAITNTYQTYQAKGLREDLTSLISNISPKETPFMSAIGNGGRAKAVLHEWQTDALAAAVTTNAQIEGDDIATFGAMTPTVRLGNYAQISRKLIIVSDTNEVVDKAGRDSEMAYQTAKAAAELKRDLETTCLSNQPASAGNSTTARKTAGLIPFLFTNTDFGGSGVDPVYTTLPDDDRTDGTLRTTTELMLKTVISSAWGEGASPNLIFVNSEQKVVISGFDGEYAKTFDTSKVKPGAIIAAADVYVSDFGTLSVVPDRFMRQRDMFVIDPAYASMVFLRPYKTVKLAKTGDAEKKMLIVEWLLKVHNEKAHAAVYDLQD